EVKWSHCVNSVRLYLAIGARCERKKGRGTNSDPLTMCLRATSDTKIITSESAPSASNPHYTDASVNLRLCRFFHRSFRFPFFPFNTPFSLLFISLFFAVVFNFH